MYAHGCGKKFYSGWQYTPTHSLRLKGFEEQSPQLKYFLSFLQDKGTQVEFLSPLPDSETLDEKTG